MSSAPIVAISLILLNAAVFILTAARGALESEASIISAGALFQPLVVQGEIWRLASAMFLHGGVDHLFGNAIGLYIFGMAAEHAYGRGQMFAIYLLAGLAGSILSVAVNTGPSVGASGAIFGLLGAMIIFFAKYRDYLHVRDKRVGNVLLIWAGFSIVWAYSDPIIDNAAHVGGLIGGAFAGMWLTPRMMKLFE